MYTIHQGLSPAYAYLSEQVKVNTVVAQTLRSGLRSASTTNYRPTIPRLGLLNKVRRTSYFTQITRWADSVEFSATRTQSCIVHLF